MQKAYHQLIGVTAEDFMQLTEKDVDRFFDDEKKAVGLKDKALLRRLSSDAVRGGETTSHPEMVVGNGGMNMQNCSTGSIVITTGSGAATEEVTEITEQMRKEHGIEESRWDPAHSGSTLELRGGIVKVFCSHCSKHEGTKWTLSHGSKQFFRVHCLTRRHVQNVIDAARWDSWDEKDEAHFRENIKKLPPSTVEQSEGKCEQCGQSITGRTPKTLAHNMKQHKEKCAQSTSSGKRKKTDKAAGGVKKRGKEEVQESLNRFFRSPTTKRRQSSSSSSSNGKDDKALPTGNS